MINKYTSQNVNNLNSHEAFDTMYMTKEQLEESKRIAKENGFGKDLKKFFVGTAIAVLGIAAVGLVPSLIATHPLVSTGIMAVGTGGFVTLGMKRFFKLMKSGNEIKNSIAQSEEEIHKQK